MNGKAQPSEKNLNSLASLLETEPESITSEVPYVGTHFNPTTDNTTHNYHPTYNPTSITVHYVGTLVVVTDPESLPKVLEKYGDAKVEQFPKPEKPE